MLGIEPIIHLSTKLILHAMSCYIISYRNLSTLHHAHDHEMISPLQLLLPSMIISLTKLSTISITFFPWTPLTESQMVTIISCRPRFFLPFVLSKSMDCYSSLLHYQQNTYLRPSYIFDVFISYRLLHIVSDCVILNVISLLAPTTRT